MKVVVTGGCGLVGRKLIRRLLDTGTLPRPDGPPQTIERIVAVDAVETPPPLPGDPRLTVRIDDISRPGVLDAVIDRDTTVVFHLAAIVSAGAEADFDLGMAVNLDATRRLLEACRAVGTVPRVVFSSSVAVFGGAMPDVIGDDLLLSPQTSYGTQKAIGELLLNDFSRKGFVDGRGLRLPTVVVRPGKPNKAASTFASSIIREPLQGQTAELPVPTDTRMYVMSPGRVVDALVHACTLPAEAWAPYRTLTLPGLTVSVAEMLAALERVGGAEARARVVETPDPAIARIVAGWAHTFDAARARSLGFQADADYDGIVRAFIAEDRVLPSDAEVRT
jgi:nucleoside-diphosphate-sugar epimerase